jgi:dipeptidyl aminopeptidase/acylaminoacyl peptidase
VASFFSSRLKPVARCLKPRAYALAALIALSGCAIASASPPSVEAFGKIPQVRNVALTPDGKTVAWEENAHATPSVLALDLAAGKVLRAFPIDPGMKLRRLSWADDATLLMDVSITHTVRGDMDYTEEFFRTIAGDIETGRTRMLLMNDATRQYVTGASLLSVRTDKPHRVTIATWDFNLTFHREEIGTRLSGKRKDSGWVHTVFSVDTRSGSANAIEYGSQFTEDWVVDPNGTPVARSDWDPGRRSFTILAKEGRGWRVVHRQDDGGRLTLGSLSPDGKSVLALGANGADRSKLWAIPLDGSGARVFVEDPVLDVESVIHDPFDGAPVAVNFGGLSQRTQWIESKAEARFKSLNKAFPGRDIWTVDRSRDGKRVVVRVESPSFPPTYYLVDFATGRADIVGEEYPGLANVKLGEVQLFSYKARDGYEVPAYLTLPPGVAREKLPLVVLPHGGPEARDDLAFDWKAQFLASRGYAVLQPQFRGSTGFGEAHRKAGYREWGGVMQHDVTDGVRDLVAKGVADPKRICIVGSSYGGYAALAGAAFTPDLYSCAVSINGLSDLPGMLGFEERQGGRESDAVAYWRDHIGSKHDPKLAQVSPVHAADKITIPVLLIHGVDDTVVPVTQSERMDRALGALQRPHKFVRLAGEDHWLSRSETRTRVLTELETFLAQHLAAPAS